METACSPSLSDELKVPFILFIIKLNMFMIMLCKHYVYHFVVFSPNQSCINFIYICWYVVTIK